MILLASPSPTNEHAFGVDDGPDHSPFPVPFPIWVTSTKPYWVTLAKHRRRLIMNRSPPIIFT